MEKEHNLLESDVVTLTLDDDVEIECAIITTFNMDSTEYIALLPLDEDGGNEDGDVWIYRFIRDTTGGSDHDLQNIEDDDEYDRAADKFDEWLDTQEFEGFETEAGKCLPAESEHRQYGSLSGTADVWIPLYENFSEQLE